LFERIVALHDLQRDVGRRVDKLGRRIAEANAARHRILGLCDGLLRRSIADDLRRLGADEIDTQRLAIDTPCDGVLLAVAARELDRGDVMTQLVAHPAVPAPSFVAELLERRLDRTVINESNRPKAVPADILMIDGALLGSRNLADFAGPAVRLVAICPVPGQSASPPEGLFDRLTGQMKQAGFEHLYVSPAFDYLIGWKTAAPDQKNRTEAG
jgi:hypothetical protein